MFFVMCISLVEYLRMGHFKECISRYMYAYGRTIRYEWITRLLFLLLIVDNVGYRIIGDTRGLVVCVCVMVWFDARVERWTVDPLCV